MNAGVLLNQGIHTHGQAGLRDEVVRLGRQAEHAAFRLLRLRSENDGRELRRLRVRLEIRSLVGLGGAVDGVGGEGAGVGHLLAGSEVDGVACASGCGNGRNANVSILVLLRCALEVDGGVYCVAGECARVGHVLARRKLHRVAEASGSRDGSNELAQLVARSRRQREGARNGLVRLALLKVLLLGNGAGERSCGRLWRGRGECVGGLVYNVLGQENVVDDALAIVLLGGGLVDTPVAIDDKLCASVSRGLHGELSA